MYFVRILLGQVAVLVQKKGIPSTVMKNGHVGKSVR